ncbi:MAG: DUF1802 family protein [Gemmataceae bacterium]
MLQHAFKEWAVICKALALGKQSILLRKGGVAEDFEVEHTRFWLYPTYVHQQEGGIQAEARPLLEEAKRERPAPGIVRLSHWVEVTGIYKVHDLIPALLLSHLHLWSDETVEKRFRYRTPGIYVLAVRVHEAEKAADVPETAAYAGCKSWVELDQSVSTARSRAVLSDERYADLTGSLDLLLRPTGMA